MYSFLKWNTVIDRSSSIVSGIVSQQFVVNEEIMEVGSIWTFYMYGKEKAL